MRNFVSKIPLLVFLITILFIIPTFGQVCQSTITFDEHTPIISSPNSEPPDIGMRYANDGLYLPRIAKIISIPSERFPVSLAHSGSNVLISADPFGREFEPLPMEINLTYPVQMVKLYTGSAMDFGSRHVSITLEALDDNFNQINSTKITLIGPTNISIPMEVADPKMQNTIRRLKVDAKYEPAWIQTYKFIDDICLISEGKPPILAREPPHIYIRNPTDGSTTHKEDIIISGEIQGEGLLPDDYPPQLIITYPTDPKSTLPKQYEQDLRLGKDLFWSYPPSASPYLEFKINFRLTHFGKNTIKIIAENPKAKTWDIVDVTYMPKDIDDEYNKYTETEKKEKFGNFVEGNTSGNCDRAIFEKGAIFSSPAGTYSVTGDIFKKWRSPDHPGNLGLLGCAISNERLVSGHRWGTAQGKKTIIADGICQDFVGGRIYSGPKGTFYVKQPFLAAIDELSFDVNFGLPVTDPVEQYNKPLLPLMWQRFEPTTSPNYFIGLSYSAMELTGKEGSKDDPFTLWVATPDILGWIKANYKEKCNMMFSKASCNNTSCKQTWTEWEVDEPGRLLEPGQYPLVGLDSDMSWNMGVGYDFTKKACYGNPDVFNTVPTELPTYLPTAWRSYKCLKKGDSYSPIFQTGTTFSSRTPYDTLGSVCKWKSWVWADSYWPEIAGHELMQPVTGTILSANRAGADSPTCHACGGSWNFGVDWDILLVPDYPQFEYLVGQKSNVLELEYEWCLVGFPYENKGDDLVHPNWETKDYMQKGMKLFAAGRWVSDCGHGDPYHTEIHPPAVMINMYTDEYLGKPVTEGDLVYLDWWYPGQVVETDIYPLPRPRADAELLPSYPSPKEITGLQNTEDPISSPNHLHIKISGRSDIPTYQNPPLVADNGQLYYGCWNEGCSCGNTTNPCCRYPDGTLSCDCGAYTICGKEEHSIHGYYILEWI